MTIASRTETGRETRALPVHRPARGCSRRSWGLSSFCSWASPGPRRRRLRLPTVTRRTLPPRRGKTTTASRTQLPDASMVRADGARVRLRHEIDDGKPVILNFIFTTCTTICPVMTQTFAEIQSRLGEDSGGVRLVSVSIDPEQDTEARLAAYAKSSMRALIGLRHGYGGGQHLRSEGLRYVPRGQDEPLAGHVSPGGARATVGAARGLSRGQTRSCRSTDNFLRPSEGLRRGRFGGSRSPRTARGGALGCSPPRSRLPG